MSHSIFPSLNPLDYSCLFCKVEAGVPCPNPNKIKWTEYPEVYCPDRRHLADVCVDVTRQLDKITLKIFWDLISRGKAEGLTYLSVRESFVTQFILKTEPVSSQNP